VTRFTDFSETKAVEVSAKFSRNPGVNRNARKRDAGRSHGSRVADRPFVSWDGEGAGDGKSRPQDYVLIGNSEGGILRHDATGYLPSLLLFAFLLKL